MNKNKLILLFLFAGFIGAFFAFDLGQYLTLSYIKQQQGVWLANLDQDFWVYSLGFFVVYVLVAATSVPGAVVLTLAAGALFGLAWGFVLVSFASSLGATLAFLFARFLFKKPLQDKWGDKLASINAGIKKDGPFYLFTLRLIPLFPFFLINLLMGLTPLKARTFYWVSQLGMIPGTLVYVNAGTQISQLDSLQGIASPGLLFSFALLGIFPFIAKALVAFIKGRKQNKRYPKPKQYDRNLVVIGAGAGGLVSSYIAAAVKAKVTLVEKHKMGGDCLNTGCVPSKAIIRSAHFAAEIKKADLLGFEPVEAKANFKAVMARVHRVIKEIEPHDSTERYSKLGVECVQGTAKIISPYEVEIDGNKLTTQNIIIATGARPFVPPIDGIEAVDYLTSDTIWGLTELPKRFLIIGAGPIGCELAQSFARLGSEVIVVDMAKRLLPREDEDVSEVLTNKLTGEGIQLKLGSKPVRFNGSDQLVAQSDSGEETIEFDKILIAIGRKANTQGLGLENLGITTSKMGTIELDEYLRTSFPNIYAVGDVAGPYQFTHFAAHQAWYASVNALFGRFKKFKADYRVIPAATYTDPQIARVGLNETEAKAQGISYEVTRYQLDDLDRAITDDEKEGFVKVLTPPGRDKILGATIVGYNAGELLGEFVLAMRHNLGLNKILGTIHAYPTMLEANKYAAGIWKQNHKPERVLIWLEKYHQRKLKSEFQPATTAKAEKLNESL